MSNNQPTSNFIDTRPLPLVSGQHMRPRSTVQYNTLNTFENQREIQCDVHPQSGIEGDKLTVVFYGYINEPLRIAFNQLILPTERKDSQGIISLLVQVPAFYKTRPVSETVHLYLTFMKKENPEIPKKQQYIGDFLYKDTKTQVNYQNFSSPMAYSPIQPQMPFNYPQVGTPFSQGVARESSFVDSSYGMYRPPLGTMGINHQQVPEVPYYPLDMQGYTTSQPPPSPSRSEPQLMSMGQPMLNEYPTWGTTFEQVNNFQPNLPLDSHQITLHPNLHPIDRRSPYRRVSRNLRGYGKAPIDFNSISLEEYNPYPDIVNPNQFTIRGNITSMLLNWSEDEAKNKRRLVRLSRHMDPYGINCMFETTSENALHTPDTMVVSCIAWPGKDTFWITSVDCINLAEFLLGTRFDVDYKNCIRRNLEGFGPTTVSKTKPDSIDFFKTIMGFNHPKPRNIEKDIKVFQWHVLPFALKKIIIKYKSEKV